MRCIFTVDVKLQALHRLVLAHAGVESSIEVIMKRICQAALSMMLGLCLSPSQAQTYPDKPVRLVVPYAPGGPTDIIARLFSEKLADLWKQPVLVDNRAGASGNVGSAQVAKAAPDGYTVLINTSSVAVNASLYTNAGYNLDKDLVGVINVANKIGRAHV